MSGTYELVAQAEYILVVALRQNECRLDSAFAMILRTMEICESFTGLGGREKRALLRDVLERIVARADATSNGEILVPASTMTTLRQLVNSPRGVESLAETIVEVTRGRAHVNAVYGPHPGDGAALLAAAEEDPQPGGCLPLPRPQLFGRPAQSAQRARRWWDRRKY
jgi:hypothetical protein